MRQYVIRRLLQSVLILFVLSVLVFLLLRIAPGGNPALLRCGLNCPTERLEGIEEEIGVNDPYFPISATSGLPLVEFNSTNQYTSWGRQLFTGSLGRDFNNNPISGELERRLPVTLELMAITLIVIIAIGIPFVPAPDILEAAVSMAKEGPS